MALICSKCGMRVDRAEAAFCPQCGSRLEPEKTPVAVQAPVSGGGNGRLWAVVTALLVLIAVLLTYILVRPESQPISAPRSVVTNSDVSPAEVDAPAEAAVSAELAPSSAGSLAEKPYASCQVGDTFSYGSYPQGQNGEVEPIEWRVLARESDRVLVITQYALASQAYNEKCEDTNWSQCTLRSWLNNEFMEKAFSAAERSKLLEVSLPNPSNYAELPDGPDTRDKVFLLSKDEAERYFSGDAERCCKPTVYALVEGASALDASLSEGYSNGQDSAYVGNCWWWLRSPGYAKADCAEAVSVKGLIGSDIYHRFYSVSDRFIAVRPAVFLAL